MSGVLASPAPSRMSSRQEQHLSVPGVGEVPTVWIGQEGRRRIGRLLEHEELLEFLLQVRRGVREGGREGGRKEGVGERKWRGEWK